MTDPAITPHLLSTLESLADLLGELEPRWAASMQRLHERASAAASPQQARDVLSDVLSLYAGMGSLNDLVLQDRSGARPEQRELSRLSAELYDEARRGR